MQAFLSYVVRESQAGRGKDIRGKTIAQDVYGRTAATDGDPDNVVRVDARRLRRCLAEYYESEGRNDPLRIHIDSGGYAPRIEFVGDSADPDRPAVEPSTPGAPRPSAKLWLITAVVLIGLACLALVLALTPGKLEVGRSEADSLARKKELERQALLEKSPTTLQAANLAEHAREMTFPLFDIERQKLATDVFKQAISLDPEYYGGYAGAAQTLASLAILVPQKRVEYLSEAKIMTGKAIELNPTQAWTQSSAAWVAFSERNYDRAIELSSRASELAPRDGYVLDIHGLVALFTGDFEAAAKATDPSFREALKSPRLAYRNIHAASKFHLGSYRETLNLFDETGPKGGPVSPPTLAYRAAAHLALGEIEVARAEARELNETWPKVRVDKILLAFFRDPDHVRLVVDRLVDAGWRKGE